MKLIGGGTLIVLGRLITPLFSHYYYSSTRYSFKVKLMEAGIKVTS